MINSIQKLFKSSRALLFACAGVLLSFLIWAAYDPCYCLWAPDKSVDTKRLPPGCAILNIPKPFTIAGGLRNNEDLVNDIRRPTPDNGELYISLLTRPSQSWMEVTPRYANEKYRFRVPTTAGKTDRRIREIRAVSDAEWEKATTLPLIEPQYAGYGGFMIEPGATLHPVDDSPLIYDHKEFKKSDSYWSHPGGLLSPGKERIAVFSYGRSRMRGNAVLDLEELLPKWRTFTIDFYDVSGSYHSTVRSWTCSGGYQPSAEWHGDQVFTLDLDHDLTLVCRFR